MRAFERHDGRGVDIDYRVEIPLQINERRRWEIAEGELGTKN